MQALIRAFARAHPLALALSLSLSLGNVVALLAVFLLALGLASGAWELTAGATALVVLRGLAVARGLVRYLDLYLGHQLMFRLITEARLRLFVAIAALRARLLPAGTALQLMLNLLQRLDYLYLRLLAPAATLGLAVLFSSAAFAVMGYGFYAAVVLLSVGGPAALLSYYALRAGISMQLRSDRFQQLHKLSVADFCSGLFDWLSIDSSSQLCAAAAHYQKRALAYDLTQSALRWRIVFCWQAWQLLGWLLALVFATSQTEPGSADWLALIALLVLQRLSLSLAPGLLDLSALSAAWRRCAQVSSSEPQLLLEPPAAALPLLNVEASYDLEFAKVSCRYPGALSDALQDFSLQVPTGQKLLVCGSSGSGKSTLAQVLGALLPLSSGKLACAGLRLPTQNSADSWLELFAFSSQHYQLLNASVREQLFSSAPDSELIATLEAVGLGAWLRRLPNGLDSWLGEGGILPSGGEYQRLQLARVLLSTAPIWVLDELSNGLDLKARSELVELIDARVGNKTLIYISHDQRQLPRLERRLELEVGRVSADSYLA